MLGLALAGLGALGKGITGLFQGAKARRIERENVRPMQQVQNEYFQNVNDAEQMARLGMPQQQYNQAIQNIQRNQSGALNQLARSANQSSGINALLRASNDATLGLDVKNAQERNQNMRYLAGQRGILGQQKQNAFDWNQKSKYLAKAAEAQALRGAGSQNLMNSFGDVTQIGMMAEQQENGGEGSKSQQSNINTFLPNASVNYQQPNFFDAMRQYGTPNYGYNGRRA